MTRIIQNELSIKLDGWVYSESGYCGLLGFHHHRVRDNPVTLIVMGKEWRCTEKDGREISCYGPQFCTSDSRANLSLHVWSPIFCTEGDEENQWHSSFIFKLWNLTRNPGSYKSRAVEHNWYIHIIYLNVQHLLIQIIIWLRINHLLKFGVMKESDSFISTLIIWFVFNFCFHGKTSKFSQTSTCKW